MNLLCVLLFWSSMALLWLGMAAFVLIWCAILKPAEYKPCPLPPPGWWCSRPKGHDGPCSARPLNCARCGKTGDTHQLLTNACPHATEPYFRQQTWLHPNGDL